MTPSPRQLELLPSAHRQAVNDLTKEMVSGRGHQVGEKRRWTCLPCAPGLAGEGLWVSSNTIKLERIKELRVDPSAAPADILSLKGLFLCLRIVTHFLMGKKTSAQMGHYLLSQPALPTFPKFSFLEENHYITLQIFRGMARKQYRQVQNTVRSHTVPKSVSWGLPWWSSD